MNVVMLLREEILCFIVLMFIVISSVLHTSRTNGRKYLPIYFAAMGYVVFDAATVYTVNHMGKVPDIINHSCHILLFLFAAYFSIEIMRYVVGIIFPETREEKLKILVGWGYLVFTLLYLLVFFCIPIKYYKGENTYYSGGPTVLFGFSIPVVFFLSAVIMLWAQRKRIPKDASLEYNEYAARLRKVAETDYLTGIYNRGAGKKKMKHAIKHKIPGVYCMLDVDDFKWINAHFGHSVGDYVLKNIADAMRKHFQKEDIIVRIGGDEFALFLANVSDMNSAKARIQEFIYDIERISVEQEQDYG